MTLHIAVLDNNPMSSAFVDRWPNDGEKVVAGLAPLRPGWQFRVWSSKSGELPPEDAPLDGVVLTGSVASANDALTWVDALAERVRRWHVERVPMAGLCFGHQLIARALGGRVGPSPGGWRLGVATTRYAQAMPWMQPPREALTLFAAHGEQVLEPPPGATVLGGDAFAPVGACALGEHVFTTQYHPELPREFLQGVLREHAAEYAPDELERTRAALEQPVDAPLFLRWLAQFLEHAAARRAAPR